LHQKKKHSWCKSGTRDTANDMPGAKQQYLAEGITRVGHFDTRCKRWAQNRWWQGNVVAPGTRRRTVGDETLRGSEMHWIRIHRMFCPGGTKEPMNTDFTDVDQESKTKNGPMAT